MHTRAEYDRKQADEIFGHVGRIMNRLASRVKIQGPKDFIPDIISAKWGVGGNEYRDVTDLLRGYLSAGVRDLRAANEFFVDHYPNRFKHLVVEYSHPRSKTIRSVTFQEGALVTFQK